MASDSPQILHAGTVLLGKFRIVRLLGAGGMGAVYEIEHELTKHRRALKLLHADIRKHPGVVERFLREASAAGRIGNPHIVETFDAGSLDSGEPYVVLELLAGETLAELLRRKTRLDLGEIIPLLAQVCDGVEAANEAGVVHRDLKPENVFLVRRDGGLPFVKLLDFGVSKFDAEHTGGLSLTNSGAALGTPLYMAPEQVRGQRDLDARADVYAIGVILYECAAGEPPFVAASLPHLAVLIHEGKATPLSERRPDLPAAFGDLVARAMAADRDQRVQSARALGIELRAIAKSAGAPDAFADTAPRTARHVSPPSPSSPPPASAAALAASPGIGAAPPSSFPPPADAGAAESGAPPARPGNGRYVAMAIGACGVGAVVALLTLRPDGGAAPRPDAHPVRAEPTASAASPGAPPANEVASAVVVAPGSNAPPPPPPPSASSSPRVVPAAATPTVVSATPVPSTRPSGGRPASSAGSRAEQSGLAKNPFP